MTKENKLLEVLNKAITLAEPFTYDEINRIIHVKDEEALMKLEQEHNELGITKKEDRWCMTTLSLIATITDVLCEKRLAFEFDDFGKVNRVLWYKKIKVP